MIGAGVFLKTRVMTCNVGSAKIVMLVWVAAGLALARRHVLLFGDRGADAGGGRRLCLPAPRLRAHRRFSLRLDGVRRFSNRIAGGAGRGARHFHERRARRRARALAHRRLHIARPARARRRLDARRALRRSGSSPSSIARPCATGGRTALVGHDRQDRAGARRGGRRFPVRAGRLVSHFGESGFGGTCEGVAASARGGIAGFGAAMLGALWAYDGWNNVAPLAGRDPRSAAQSAARFHRRHAAGRGFVSVRECRLLLRA